jgi:hypothetical protein
MKAILSKNIDTIKNIKIDIPADNIFLITQFYISTDTQRNDEIKYCLKRNIELGIFNMIYLINERKYTNEELGLNENELKCIKQIIFDKGTRMTYMHAFGLVLGLRLHGYIIISNSDIFFDNTLLNLEKTSLQDQKSVYALLRFEYRDENNLEDCKIFGPRNDSQDTWIFHSKYLPNDFRLRRANFLLGKAGCDNAIAHIFHDFGFILFNEPHIIKTYHYHKSQYRNYSVADKIGPPYCLVNPVIRKS